MLAKLIEQLSSYIEQLILVFGTPGIAIIAFMENIFPPTPSEFLYPLAGKLAYDGQASLFGVILAGAIGSLVGAFVFYYLGYFLGEKRVRNFIKHYGTVQIGRWQVRFITVQAYDQAMKAFKNQGAIIVIIARTVPLVHGIISIPAGVSRMNIFKFLLYSLIGVMLWIVPTVLLGYFLGSQWDVMLHALEVYETVWYILIATAIVLYVAFRWFKHHQQTFIESNQSP